MVDKLLDKETSNKITWTMFVCSIIILLRHASGYGNYELDLDKFGDACVKWFIDTIRYDGVFNVALPVFFFFSGFLFFKNYGWDRILEKFRSRIKTLCIPYLFWNTVWMLFVAIISFLPGIADRMNQIEVFELSFGNVIEGIFLHKYNPVFWYVLQLIIYVVLAPGIYALVKNKYLGAVIAVLLFINDIYELEVFSILNEYIPINGLSYYLLGAYIGIHFAKYLNKPFSSAVCVMSTGMLLVLVLLYPVLCRNRMANMLVTMGEVIMLWFLMDLFRKKEVYWWIKIYFYIYAVHYYVQLCVNKILYLILPQKTIIVLINFVAGSLFTMGICVLTAKFLMKKFPKFWEIITGGR